MQGALDLGAGGVPAGVDDPPGPVTALAGELERAVGVAVEFGAEVDQVGDPVGAFGDGHLDRGRVAQAHPGDLRVHRVRGGGVERVEHGGHASCAHRVEPSSMLTLVTTVTWNPACRRLRAQVRPATPEPMTHTSVVSVQDGASARSRRGRRGRFTLPRASA
ncbi:hypothetical protein GCM10029992_09920 [Glycomyces albus]